MSKNIYSCIFFLHRHCTVWTWCDVSADSPQIVCHAAEAEVGERNVCVRCDVTAKPTATTVFWIVADNGSSVLAGQVTDEYWVVIKVRHFYHDSIVGRFGVVVASRERSYCTFITVPSL